MTINKEHLKKLANYFAGDYDCMNNNDAIVFAIKFLEHLIEKGEFVESEKEYIRGCRECADSIEMDSKGNQMCSTYDGQYCDPYKHREVYRRKETQANLISDEEIQRYITAAHPDTVGHKPIQLLMAEKIRISLEWMREQLTNKS